MAAIMSERENGARLSKNHRLVHEIVKEQGRGTHLAMSDLYQIARERRPGIGFTTVYRAITRLRDLGIVDEIVIPGAERAVYEPAGPKHAHFRCTTCGNVQDVDYHLPAAVTDQLAATIGGHVSGVDVSLHGRCARCLAG
jgi:Fe2+ or Zn2+ uptake regulation protein